MKKRSVRRRHKQTLVIRSGPKWDVGLDDVSFSLPDVPELHLVGIQVIVPSRKPATEAEKKKARAKFENLLRNKLPLKGGRCLLPIGENLAEVITEKQEPLSKEEFEEVFRQFINLLTHFPPKIHKGLLAEEITE